MSTPAPERSKGTSWTPLLIILLTFLCCILVLMCAALAAVGVLVLTDQEQPTPTPIVILVTATPTPGAPPIPTPDQPPQPTLTWTSTPVPMRSPTATPTPDTRGRITVEEAARIPIPTRDLRILGMRFNPDLGEVPAIVNTAVPRYEEGDTRTFWVSDVDNNKHFQIEAVLEYITPHAYFWVQDGERVNRRELKKAARFFEENIYPTNRRIFGEEWEPGVDNDPHITFLHARGLGKSVAGYFSSADSFPREVSPYSNETDMFYISLDATEPGDPFYLQVIAHEFQHMIHWYQDRNEETWLNEGFSVLAEVLNGFPMGLHVNIHLNNPDLQLTAWSDSDATPHYGAAGLFSYYLYEQFGEEFIRRVARHPENGMAAVDIVLDEMGKGLTARDVFANWLVANLVNDPNLGNGEFGYREQIDDTASWTDTVEQLPTLISGTVAQYGADYIHLRDVDTDTVTVTFQGNPVTRLAPLTPHSGRFVMWSNRSDDSDSRLYTEVDLTNVQTATLTFWTWYDIENLWDFAYVVVSTDGGKHWQMLETPNMTRENPYGNNLGVGYTGVSGGGERPEWIQERIDLSPFAGQKILLGFEYVTDDAFTRPGFFLDDVRIEGAGLEEDFEAPLQGWVQEGFIRTDTFVPQDYLVQVVHTGRGRFSVEKYIFPSGTLPQQFTISGVSRGDTTIIVSALAPLTWETASYTLDVRPQR